MEMAAAEMVPLAKLLPASWNANRVSAETLPKIRRSIEEFGFVENLVARKHPTSRGKLEVLSGNHRLRLLAELGVAEAPVVLVEVGDADARILAQALNRTRGEDDPEAYARLLEDVLADVGYERVVGLLPETESSIDRLLREWAGPPPVDPDEVPPLPRKPRSKPGEVYELGGHRLMCGDATNPDHVATLLAGTEPVLLLTDPPYGVELDMEWRDRAGRNGLGPAEPSYLRSEGHTNTSISGDTKADWSDAFALVPSLKVAYVWHADRHTVEVGLGLRGIGFDLSQLIVWRKPQFVLSRTHYHSQHEPCWYARKPGAPPWIGSNDQATVWEAASPKMLMRPAGEREEKVDHPTQKPASLYATPLSNHIGRGQSFYEPFAGSGTAIIAAETTGRVCLAMELDPRYCDVIRDRYERFAGGNCRAA